MAAVFRMLPNCSSEAVLQRRGADIQNVDFGEPGVYAGHLHKQQTIELQTNQNCATSLNHIIHLSKKEYPNSRHTLQVTIAPTSGSSCVSVSLTTEITGN